MRERFTPSQMGPEESPGLIITPISDTKVRVDRRFAKYAQLPCQYKFHRLNARFRALIGPVGTGKTVAICREAVKVAYINAGTMGLIAAPTFSLVRDVALRTMVDILEDEKIPFRSNYSDGMWIHLTEPNTLILFRSMDNPERLRGRNLSFFGVDELSYCKEAAWQRLEARLREPKANFLTAFAALTPKGRDWIWKRFVNPKTRLPMHDYVQAKPGENRAVLDKNPYYYEALKNSYDERFYRQEALGEFLDVYGGNVYWAFSQEHNVRPLNYVPKYPVFWSLDFNVNPLCSVIGQFIPIDAAHTDFKMHVLDEIYLPGATTPDACEEFFHRWGPKTAWNRLQVDIYGDPSGKSRSTASSETDWEIIRKAFERHPEYEARFHVPDSHPLVKDRVNTVNSYFKNAAGQIRMQVDPKCRQLIMDLEDVKWRTDKDGNILMDLDKSDYKRTHMSDALGYCCHTESQLQTRARLVGQIPF